ncbi:MAG: Uncharacterized protein AUK64_1861 [bacterium P201]|nr:MAG: Uncharacterized protein AUK64_1861 [bacterium P201]
MKKILLFSVLGLCACSQDDFFETSVDTDVNFVTSGAKSTDLYGGNAQNVETDIFKVEYIKKGSEKSTRGMNHAPHKAISLPYDGTAQGTPHKTLSNQKVIINGVTGIVTGVYIADIYTTSGKIELPSGATDVEFDLPDVCGYCDWTTREEGIIKSTKQTKKNGVIKNVITWSFYTMVLTYNMSGIPVGKVLPKDGSQILIPYRFVY